MKDMPVICPGCGQVVGRAWTAPMADEFPGVVIEDVHECPGRWAA